jgi:hypothetical protein
VDAEEARRVEAVIREDERVADVAVLVLHDQGCPTTYVVVGANTGHEGQLPIGEYLHRTGLMGPRGALCGMLQIGRFPRTASGEVDRPKLVAVLERLLAAGD